MNTCTIDVKEKEYTFCLNREAIKWLEARGMVFADLDRKLITYTDLFWIAGLIPKHGELTEREAMDLMSDYESEGGDVYEVISFLIDEYSNFVYALTDTKSNKTKKAKIVKAHN